MKKYFLAALAATTLASGADAASFTFSFADDRFGTNGVVTGVIDGLVEGNNDVSGLSVTITSAPGIVSNGFVFSSDYGYLGSATMTSGQITFANLLWNANSTYLWLGTDPAGGTFFPTLFNAPAYYNGDSSAVASSSTGVTFSPVVAAAVPEPATWAMMIAGFGMIGAGARQRRRSTTVAYA